MKITHIIALALSVAVAIANAQDRSSTKPVGSASRADAATLVCDGSTDIGPALQAAIDSISASKSPVIQLPPGTCALNSPVVLNNVALTIQGQGYTEGPSPGLGTWIKISAATFMPFTIRGDTARGTVFKNLAITEVQPGIRKGWAPAPYPFVFNVQNTLGEVTFDHILLAGVTNGIYAYNSGRLNVQSIFGQVYNVGIKIDQCLDIPRIDYVHFWPYVTSDPNILAYQQVTLDAILLGRVDGIYLGDIFALGERSVIRLTNFATGTTTKAYVSNLYADFAQYGIWIDSKGDHASVQVANATTQHNDFNGGARPLSESAGLEVDSKGDLIEIANWRTNLVESSAFRVTAPNSTLHVQSFVVSGYNSRRDGSAAIAAAPGNAVSVGFFQLLDGNNGPLASANGVVQSNVAVSVPANAVNFPLFGAAPAGSGVVTHPVGKDSDVDYTIGALGATGSVRLVAGRSGSQPVARVDNPSGGDTDILFRSSSGAIDLIAESSQTNADISIAPKGSGRLLLNGSQLTSTLKGVTGQIGITAVPSGGCTKGTASVQGSTTSMVVLATPVTPPAPGFSWRAYVSAPSVVTVEVCNTGGATAVPGASVYNVRVFQ